MVDLACFRATWKLAASLPTYGSYHFDICCIPDSSRLLLSLPHPLFTFSPAQLNLHQISYNGGAHATGLQPPAPTRLLGIKFSASEVRQSSEMESGKTQQQQQHFVLVHGLGHGAWCWYKVATALRSAGHRVTAVDLASCGVHPARVDEVRSFEDYSRPLLDAVEAAAAAPDGAERLVLVGHSHGGLSVALAAERFPGKVAAVVFVTASMPCVGRRMGVITDEINRRSSASPQGFMDSKMLPINTNQYHGIAILMGPKFLAEKAYQLSPAEDLALATMLVRPGNQFVDDPMMKDEALLTDGNYGSVKRVYVVAKDDDACGEELQRWMVALSPGTVVEEIAGADHAVMCSKPQELSDLLMEIANKYH